MDGLLIVSTLLFWLFSALALKAWYDYRRQKQALTGHLIDLEEFKIDTLQKEETRLSQLFKRLFKYADDFSALGQRINFFSEKHEVEDWLRKAGYPYDLTVERFQGIKIFATVVGFGCGLVAIVLGLPLAHFGVIFLPLIGYFGVILTLKGKAKARQDELRYDLPDFLDIVSVSLKAGVSLDATLREVVKYFDGPLREEFMRFNHEIELGVPREEAYRELLKRNDNEEFQTLIKSLIQGMQLGVPIATTFKIQADDMRTLRRELVKEKAAKASPKITLITTFVVAPTAIMMIAGLMIINMFFGENSLMDIFK
ncbi:pilus assembly protein TadB [Ammoniphilus oxalaticus]|uniref:Pilus assembly protein TadB n=1 Tax=Ammoniphilus oxalaticus TaxID=66863 RepID=A0A419SKB9_9BACL|nr:type II secretion system F family protein [Ammoniphilus oxalaticus]RKD24481.1 pilus assembly protein TadB [Ammoniphilus oxalaticus]